MFLRPTILQGYDPVENRLAWTRIRIDAEISVPEELEALSRRKIGEPRLNLAAGKHLEGSRVEVIPVILSFFHLVEVFDGEQMVIEPHFRFHRMRG